MLKLRLSLSISLALLAANAAAQSNIDDFAAAQAQLQASPAAGSTQTGAMLGGERDVRARRFFGGGVASVQVVGGVLVFTGVAGTPAEAQVIWDGLDGDSSTTAFTGLSGTDLTTGGADSIVLDVNSASAGSIVIIEVFSTAQRSSLYTFRLPAVSTPSTFALPFSAFSAHFGGGANFSSVGAIALTVRGAGAALALDAIRAGAGAPAQLAVTKTGALSSDVNGNAIVNPGDTVKYTIQVENKSGKPSPGDTNIVDVLATALSLVAGSVEASPIARADYTFPGSAAISVAAPGVLGNDNDPDGDALSVATPGLVTTSTGAIATINANGSYSLTAPADGTLDTFSYELTDGNGISAFTVVTVGYVPTAAPPTFDPTGGSFEAGVSVTVSTATSGATIFYTLNGADPNETSTPYAGPISVGASATLKARALHPTLYPSAITTATYVIYAGTPVITPATGTYVSTVAVSIAPVAGASIRFTTDGQEPTPASTLYGGPFNLTASATVKARAFATGWTPSATATATYVVRVADPILSPAFGKWYTQRNVQVTTSTPGATIHYTTDGSEPTTGSSTVTGGQVLVERSLVLRVKAVKSGLQSSGEKHGAYLITGQVAGGQAHSLALKANGEVWGWGGNYSGQVGDGGAATARLNPVLVLSGVIEIAAGTTHSVALKADGTVWTWGENSFDKLGRVIAPATPATVPGQVALGGIPAIAIAAGGSHTLAVLSNGEIRSWGANYTGQLGRGVGNFAGSATPVAVVTPSGPVTNAVAVAAGSLHSMALRADGTVLAWGSNTSGSLGDGTNTTRTTATVIASLAGVKSISTMVDSSYAVMGGSNDLKSWGLNSSGQLGDGTTTNRLSPTLVKSGVWMISAGGAHQAFAGGDGRGWGAGRNIERQLGDATAGNRSLPVPSRMTKQTTTLGQGVNHSLAVDGAGAVWATGFSLNGQLGLGHTNSPFLPTAIPALSLFDGSNLPFDLDQDGLTFLEEFIAGTDPLVADTNGNGLTDGAEHGLGLSSSSNDTDGDGLANDAEILAGTNPFAADTDGDGYADGVDQLPLDPTKNALTPTPGDATPPVITLLKPFGALIIP